MDFFFGLIFFHSDPAAYDGLAPRLLWRPVLGSQRCLLLLCRAAGPEVVAGSQLSVQVGPTECGLPDERPP